MSITNSEQALAQELIETLGDKKKNVFGLYMKLIKIHGTSKIRATLSEVVYDYRKGRITNRVKVFLYRIKQ